MNNLAADFGMKSRDGAQMALQRVTVMAHISGVLAETRLTQHYLNATGGNLEIAYTFPLPTDAVLLAFDVKLGERQFAGHVLPRQEAEEGYEQAIGQGDSAFRLQQVNEGIYSVALGNVAPDEAVVLTLRYSQMLTLLQGRLRYRLPTTLAPRYGEPSGMEPWQRPATALTAEYPLEVEVAVSGAWAKGAFQCPTHAVSCTVTERGIRLASRGAFLDRDLILDLRPQTLASTAIATRREGGLRLGAFLLPPAVPVEGQPGHNYVLVIDCSGSMQGDSLAQAKAGVRLALERMAPQDRFALIAFGSHIQPFDAALQPANRKNLALAAGWVERLGDLGGTELSQALLAALKYAEGSDASARPLDILLLTDGECWATAAATTQARAKSVRLFTIGVGSAAAEDMVRKLAERTDGAWEMVTPHEDMAERIAVHFARMSQPRLERIELDAGVEPLWLALPQRANFAGDAVAMFAELPGDLVLPPTITARLYLTDGSNMELPIPLTEAGGQDGSLWRIAAAHRLPALRRPEERQEWAVQHQLLTPETDYLLTVARPDGAKADGLPELHIVPHMLAAGWGANSLVLHEQAQSYPTVFRIAASAEPRLCRSGQGQADEAWGKCPGLFLADVRSASTGLLRRRLPQRLADLPTGNLPRKLLETLTQLAQEGWDEAQIIVGPAPHPQGAGSRHDLAVGEDHRRRPGQGVSRAGTGATHGGTPPGRHQSGLARPLVRRRARIR
jgi:Ca-activated chloride channel homolog